MGTDMGDPRSLSSASPLLVIGFQKLSDRYRPVSASEDWCIALYHLAFGASVFAVNHRNAIQST